MNISTFLYKLKFKLLDFSKSKNCILFDVDGGSTTDGSIQLQK
jgi:hypothetical protein